MRTRALAIVLLLGLAVQLAGCPFFTRRPHADREAAGAAD